MMTKSSQFIQRALPYTSGNHYFLCEKAQPHRGRGEYIVIHRQTVSLYILNQGPIYYLFKRISVLPWLFGKHP